VPLEGEAVQSEAEFWTVSVRKGIAMAGAMTGEDKEENEGLEGVQTPKENGTGEYMIHAQGSCNFVQDTLKEEEE
jgi:hypothetical protein